MKGRRLRACAGGSANRGGCTESHTRHSQSFNDSTPAYNFRMKGLIGLLIVSAIGMGIYMYTLKQASPTPGMAVTQSIDVTGVKMDLMSIAQAERMYYAQNGSYADLNTLASNGTMNITRTSRGGYTYSVDTTDNGFTATARYTAPPVEMPAGVAPPHWPTISVDQTMAVHQDE
jgi:Type IV minor pilin ComP, DNA uptake sequence receptor